MTVKEFRSKLGLSQAKMGEKFHIPAANISLWEQGIHTPSKYVMYMMQRIVYLENKIKEMGGQVDEEDRT